MTRVAYPVAAHGKSVFLHLALLVFGAVAVASGCKAGVVATQTGTGGHAGSSSGSAGTRAAAATDPGRPAGRAWVASAAPS